MMILTELISEDFTKPVEKRSEDLMRNGLIARRVCSEYEVFSFYCIISVMGELGEIFLFLRRFILVISLLM